MDTFKVLVPNHKYSYIRFRLWLFWIRHVFQETQLTDEQISGWFYTSLGDCSISSVLPEIKIERFCFCSVAADVWILAYNLRKVKYGMLCVLTVWLTWHTMNNAFNDWLDVLTTGRLYHTDCIFDFFFINTSTHLNQWQTNLNLAVAVTIRVNISS